MWQWKKADNSFLHSLRRLSPAQQELPQLRMALANAHPLVNKTFICNDFISSNVFDFWSWIKQGDLSPFSKWMPPDYEFLNNPCLTSQGGGLVTIFWNTLHCKLLSTSNLASFEVQLIHLDSFKPVLIILIYRLPGTNTNVLLNLQIFWVKFWLNMILF